MPDVTNFLNLNFRRASLSAYLQLSAVLKKKYDYSQTIPPSNYDWRQQKESSCQNKEQ